MNKSLTLITMFSSVYLEVELCVFCYGSLYGTLFFLYKTICLVWRLVEKNIVLSIPPLPLGLPFALNLTEGCSSNTIPLYILTQNLSDDGETEIGFGSVFCSFDETSVLGRQLVSR